MILSIVFVLTVTAAAGLATYRLPLPLTLEERISWGVVIGLAVGSLAAYFLALFLPITVAGTVVLGLAILLATALLHPLSLWRSRLRADFSHLAARWCRRELIPLLMVTAFFGLLFLNLFFFHLVIERTDGLYVGEINTYADLPRHLAYINSFVKARNIPPQQPFFTGERLTYHFAMDFLSALMILWGTSLTIALALPAFVLCSALVILLYYLGYRLSGSHWAAALALVLFFFSGGLGFIYFFKDTQEAGLNLLQGFLQITRLATKEYTDIGHANLHWPNIITANLMPQRAILLGLPLSIIILSLLWGAVQRGGRRTFIAAGVLLSLLPLVHMHSLVALAIILVPLCLLFPRREWLFFLASSLPLLAVEMALVFPQTAFSGRFFRYQWGWMSQVGAAQDSIILFWLKNAGPLLLLLILALLRPSFRRSTFGRFFLPFVLLFVVGNIVLFQVYVWGNQKILLYWYLLSTVVVAEFLVSKWRRRDIYVSALLGVLATLVVLSGFLDVYRNSLPNSRGWRIFNSVDFEASTFLEEHTPPHAIFLTPQEHTNMVAVLAGRQTLLGWELVPYGHGIPYEKRQEDIRLMYQGAEECESLLREYAVDYVLISPVASKQYQANISYFEDRFPLVFENERYQIFQVSVRE